MWATWTLEDHDFLYGKAARNSGRASAGINLLMLIGIAYYGLKSIYKNQKKRDALRVIITLLAINHLIHFFFVYQNFKSRFVEFNPVEHLHGMITFICILLVPLLLWKIKKLNALIYFGIILHLFNVTYFMMKTSYSKITPERPGFVHQIRIGIMLLVLLYVLLSMFRERRENCLLIRPK